MGVGLATNLHKFTASKSLPPLSYTNRTLSRGDSLKAQGAIPYNSISEVANVSDVVFSSIADDSVLLSLMDEFIAAGEIAGKVLVDTSTVHPKTATTAAQKLHEHGATFIAAPVFGASPAAAAGTVLIAAAGPSDALSTIVPFLNAMGRKVIIVGEQPAQALLLKTTSNILMAGLMQLVAEAHVFAEKTGLSSSVLEDLLEENFGTVIHSDSKRMTTGVYADGNPWSNVGLAVKDVGHGVEMAKETGFTLPVGDLALSHLQRARSWGERETRSLDSTSIYGVVRQNAGLDFETELVKEKVRKGANAEES